MSKFRVGDRVEVVNENSSIEGYRNGHQGTVVSLDYRAGLDVKFDGSLGTFYVLEREVKLLREKDSLPANPPQSLLDYFQGHDNASARRNYDRFRAELEKINA